MPQAYAPQTRVADVIADPVFAGFGRLLFPTTFGPPAPAMTLRDLPRWLPFHNCIRADTTTMVLNELRARAAAGETIFYPIYTGAEQRRDPALRDTGLFFFRGRPGAPFAAVNAGGGFYYVGAIHESLPHALALSRKGYNAFALIYRPDSACTACTDLARALGWIVRHAEDLQLDPAGYSLWGGSAGARMAAWVGGYGAAAFGGDRLPKPAAVIMQYTGLSEYDRGDPPTYACVGTADGIAPWRVMKGRINGMAALGIPTEFHLYPGLPHGFGLGIGTRAEGWLDEAASFWRRQRENQVHTQR